MTVTLELKPELEAEAQAQAQAQGLPLEQYLQKLIETALPPQQQTEAIKQRNIERNKAAIAALDSFMEGDEQEQRETLEYLKRVVDEDRPGQRRVFGKGYNP